MRLFELGIEFCKAVLYFALIYLPTSNEHHVDPVPYRARDYDAYFLPGADTRTTA